MNHEIKITNTLSRKKEVFAPLNPPNVGMYVCGPTVYNLAHLGNVRTFISFDIMYRYLQYLGYKVRYVRNITDVGHITNDDGDDIDTIGEQAKKENLEPMEIVNKYTRGFHDIMKTFNVSPPDIEPTATGHIIEQIEMVERIIENGFAYEINGSVYFNVPKFASEYPYGKLSGRNIDDQREGHRELDAQDEKRDTRDFAIWKAADETFPMRWTSPWGKGVPGWHLECSVMSTKYLGEKFDIHGGGMDLKFPHHEAEIAQSKAADGTDPVQYWLHTNMLTMNGKKMSKSLGNSIWPEELITGENDLMEKGFSPMVIRFFMLQSHYASELDLSNDALMAAEKGYKRLINALEILKELEYIKGDVTNEDTVVQNTISSLFDHMNDDFSSAQALASLFELSNKINAYKNKQADIGEISSETFTRLKKEFTAFISQVLGLTQESSSGNGEAFSGVMELVLDMRKEAKENKDYNTSDKIRDALKSLNIEINDEKDGSVSWNAN